ncbi:hypothetical protein GCM10010245_06240 [Streptomyces spectabilis]|nr:hypothetical protein GCM10010245_06240 [Streptomyces spectabilis]
MRPNAPDPARPAFEDKRASAMQERTQNDDAQPTNPARPAFEDEAARPMEGRVGGRKEQAGPKPRESWSAAPPGAPGRAPADMRQPRPIPGPNRDRSLPKPGCEARHSQAHERLRPHPLK